MNTSICSYNFDTKTCQLGRADLANSGNSGGLVVGHKSLYKTTVWNSEFENEFETLVDRKGGG